MPSALDTVDRLVAGSATALTRRRLLRNSAATVATGTMLAALWRPGPAYAECVATIGAFSSDRICGPRPYCNDWRCYSSGACHNTSQHKPTAYGGSSCIGSGDNYLNCWCVCKSNNLYRCCDCCADTYQGGQTLSCSSCGGGTWYQCACRGTRCTSCC